MTLNNLQEQIVKLYLRLNGYIVNDLIIHSEKKGANKTQLDVIGIRFPFHKQIDRQIECSKYLDIPKDKIDILIGEVKGGKEQIHFNPALHRDKEALEKLINWLGLFDDDDVNKAAIDLIPLVTPKKINSPDKFEQLIVGNFSVRPLLFALDRREPSRNQVRYVYGQLMIKYIWDCFRPEQDRETCSTIYDTNSWGYGFSEIVEYFKDKKRKEVGTVEDLYDSFKERKIIK